MISTSKADTLIALQQKLKLSYVLPILKVDYLTWCEQPLVFISQVLQEYSKPLVVRSSAASEDVIGQSKAGKYVSCIGVLPSAENIKHAVDEVFNSYVSPSDNDQVFIQPQLVNATISGVIFSHDPTTGSPYYCVNYDDETCRTDSVTSGDNNDTKVAVISHFASHVIGWKKALIEAVHELQAILATPCLDIEFAIDKHGKVCLFQVRELLVRHFDEVPKDRITLELNCIHNKVFRLSQPHPYLLGETTLYGVMPDWNPAEIIGVKPRPLALSLYKELVTDDVWSYQRSSYGYRDVKDFPLLVVLGGTPFIDTRVSFNSFIPVDLPHKLANKLVNYYLQCLQRSPELHDKVEFSIVISCFDFNIDKKLSSLIEHGFTLDEVQAIKQSLFDLTRSLVEQGDSIWCKDLLKVDELKHKRQQVQESSLNSVEQIYWLLKDCKNYGTLPFAGLARVGFIAMQMLESLVEVQAVTAKRKVEFLSSINTVSTHLVRDKHQLDKASFIEKYGHLRPGTYDITSKRYDEDPDLYFDWTASTQQDERKEFLLTQSEQTAINHVLKQQGFTIDSTALFAFFQQAIEAREYGKFIFTQSLSEALVWLEKLAAKLGFSRDDISYANIKDVLNLYSTSLSATQALKSSIQLGKQHYLLCQKIQLPHLISKPEQAYQFSLMHEQPNFITLNKVTAKVHKYQSSVSDDVSGKIIFIESADPGYDWLFSKNIAGLVTKYGGCNSHMAIRAGELNVAAIIGAGDRYFTKWSEADKLTIDCANQKVECL